MVEPNNPRIAFRVLLKNIGERYCQLYIKWLCLSHAFVVLQATFVNAETAEVCLNRKRA